MTCGFLFRLSEQYATHLFKVCRFFEKLFLGYTCKLRQTLKTHILLNASVYHLLGEPNLYVSKHRTALLTEI